MSKKPPMTSICYFVDRHVPIGAFADITKKLAASDVVDDLGTSDQMNSFFPPMLWNAKNTPLFDAMPDIDSHPDGQAMLAYMAALAPHKHLSIMTDSARHGPSEQVQSMLTLANMMEGRVTYQFGGGEVKQFTPYGWKRSEGLARMEDLFKIFHLYWNSKPGELVSYTGNCTSLQKASLGGAKGNRPTLWGLGAGPKLLNLVATYCDGTSVATPCMWHSIEKAEEEIATLRNLVASKGRNPDDFTIGIVCPVMLHEDPAVIDRALDNPLIRWLAAVFGRNVPTEWAKDGLESPWPKDWNYYMKLIPMWETPEFVNEVLSKTTRRHAELGSFNGTPAQVAAILQKYVDLGVSWVQILDYLPLTLQPEDGAKSWDRAIEVCARLKGKIK